MGRSYLGPPDKGIRQVLFSARERGGGAIPFCLQLALAGRGFPGRRPGLFHFTDIFFETAANHHWQSLDLFKYGFGGGHVPKPNPKDHASYTLRFVKRCQVPCPVPLRQTGPAGSLYQAVRGMIYPCWTCRCFNDAKMGPCHWMVLPIS